MRVFSRIALTLVVVLLATPMFASHFQADCPLQLVASTPAPATAQFYQSPHGAFRFGNLVFVLRGQALTTYNVTDLGDIQNKNVQPRQDFLGSLGGRESS
ncbi:MAG TPA: hypothetical protein VK648_13420, partial [Gemmatimonadaceae bacterium]|nr:hypothetical protein [Gemmatimonadaceae bacterium]